MFTTRHRRAVGCVFEAPNKRRERRTYNNCNTNSPPSIDATGATTAAAFTTSIPASISARSMASRERSSLVEEGSRKRGAFHVPRPPRPPPATATASVLYTTLLLLFVIFQSANGATSSASAINFEPRTFDGTGNNIDWPLWGSVGVSQIRSIAGSDYADEAFSPPGDDRPSAREVMTDVFLASTSFVTDFSALFVAWGQLMSFDMFLTEDNVAEPFDVDCDDGGGFADVWCPLGEASDPISFDRSNATVNSTVRSPTNYATAYLDLDFVYGRSEEEAESLRTLSGGTMQLSDSGIPLQNTDGTWLIADQRSARFPVTFALHSVLLSEHNRCCEEVAPDLGFTTDEDIYQACRVRTIASYQHIGQNDFSIRLLTGPVMDLAVNEPWYDESLYGTDDDDDYRRRRLQQENGVDKLMNNGEVADYGNTKTMEAPLIASTHNYNDIQRLLDDGSYHESIDAGADVLVSTIGPVAFEAMLPSTLRIVNEGYEPADEDNIELHVACKDIAGLFERNTLASILRGAVLSPALKADAHFSSTLSNVSPLFKLPVDAVQRGRDHGLPTYNDARVAYGLAAATEFTNVTDDTDVASLLDAAYGGDVDLLDAVTGALAEATSSNSPGVIGMLMKKAWLEQLFRARRGDRLYHLHSRTIEDVEDTVASAVLSRTVDNLEDLPLSVFTTPDVAVCGGDCSVFGVQNVTLSDEFGVAWQVLDDDSGMLSITLRAKGVGIQGMLAIGWGGTTMADATDFVVCQVDEMFTPGAECIDRQPVSGRNLPDPDSTGETNLTVNSTAVVGDWTFVNFLRLAEAENDEEDYDLQADIDASVSTFTIYSYRTGEGLGQHPNANRGAAEVNYATSESTEVCTDGDDFVSLHGCLMLVAWMILAPIGIYYVRYRKGEEVPFGLQWYEMHQEIMILAAEAILPMGITAIFALDADHRQEHAKWGFVLIALIAMQVITGFFRVAALEAKQSNFSLLHRINKYFHIWSGRFAYISGVIQCYRGLELVSDSDTLLFSAVEGLDLQLGNFGFTQRKLFPAWLGVMAVAWLFLESRKQLRRYSRKGVAKVCACVKIINEEFDDNVEQRLVPRTEDVPMYTMQEFNDKVLNGQSWVLVDGAILDVSEFSHRHPGGARLILNALGTDVTQELLGEDQSVGHAMSFNPHKHPQWAWTIVRGLVIGYIEEDDGEEDEEGYQHYGGAGGNAQYKQAAAKSKRVKPSSSMLPGGQANPSMQDNFGSKAQRLNRLGSLPSRASVQTASTAAGSVSVLGTAAHEDQPSQLVMSPRTRLLLERFHVCPLLFRERMGPTVDKKQARPVYKYVFTCPGKAEILVKSIKGVGHFNLRVSKGGQGVVQRAYNAFAVRVKLASGSESTPVSPRDAGAGDEGGPPGSGARGERQVVPANETTEGILCIEMRIRHYHDGAMSQLLEKLANDPDNPAVQLQGPFLIDRVIPPPAHRNVVMIAAGTGINPMVQLIRDYQARNRRAASQASKSRLALLWQCTSEGDFYCTDELTAMQALSNGLLEVTALISGEHRKRNVPGAAFKRAKAGLMAASRRMASSVSSSQASSSRAMLVGRPPRNNSTSQSGESTSSATTHRRVPSSGVMGTIGERKEAEEIPSIPVPILSMGAPREFSRPQRAGELPTEVASMSMSGGGLIRGKVTGEVVERVLGDVLLKALDDFQRNRLKRRKFSPKAGTAGTTANRSSGGDNDNDNDDYDDDGDDHLEVLCGTQDSPGKLQVVVSGPAGFVFHVENLLADMGVPREAIVLLD